MKKLLLLSALLLTACNSVQNPENSVPVNTNTVHIAKYTYNPANILITKGQSVTWINDDTIAHTVTGNSFSSGKLLSGQSYTYQFKKSGEYRYNCDYHHDMQGIVNVQK